MNSLDEKQPFSIALVGNSEQKQQFIKKAKRSFKGNWEEFPSGLKCDRFKIWPYLGIEGLGSYTPEITFAKTYKNHLKSSSNDLYNVKAIIYLNPLQNQRAFWEMVRKQSACIAIECDSKHCNPKDYFHEIEKLICVNKHSPYTFFQDRAMLLLMSNKDKSSAFADLPQEVIHIIYSKMLELPEKEQVNFISEALPSQNEGLDAVRVHCMIQ